MIEIKDGIKIYESQGMKHVAFNKLNLLLEDNCYTSIIGPSGCGKSTLLNILAGYDFLTRGEYYYDFNLIEDNIKSIQILKKNVGMIFQDYKLLDYLNIKDNLLLPSLYTKIKPDFSWVNTLNIEDCLKQYPHQLSGGQKQRVSIARILMYNKKMILADEPTGALDGKNTEKLLEIFDDLHKQNVSIVLVTHDLNVANHCQNIINLEVENDSY